MQGVEELWGRERIAKFLDVSLPTLDRIRKGRGLGTRGAFPRPVAEVGDKPRWSPTAIDCWQRGEVLMTGLLLRVELKRGETVESVFAPMQPKTGDFYQLAPLPTVGNIGAMQLLWPAGQGLTPEVLALLMEPLAGRLAEASPLRRKTKA